MGPKRGQTVQIQTRIENDNQLYEWLKHEGLGLIDLYSDWCGPCASMLPYLKRIKMDLTSPETLTLATVKSDTVEALNRLTGRSEPTWIFTSRGKLIRLFRGSNYPRLYDVIQTELKKQRDADAGHDTRLYTEIAELTPEEQVVADAKALEENIKAERDLEENLRKIEERRLEVISAIAKGTFNETVLIIWPKFAQNLKKLQSLRKYWDERKFSIQERRMEQLTMEQIDEFRKFADWNLSDLATSSLLSAKAMLWLIKYESEMIQDYIEDLVSSILYGSSQQPPGDPDSIAELFFHTIPYPVEEKEFEGIGEEDEVEDDKEKEETKHADEEEEREEEEEEEEEYVEPKLVKRISIKKSDSVMGEEEEEDIQGELAPGIWTPLTPVSLGRGTVILTLFNEMASMFIPPIISPIPPHIAFVFKAENAPTVVKTMQTHKFVDQILNYGFFENDDVENPKLVANSFLDYKRKPLHTPDEVLVLSVSQKKSFAAITLAELGPKFVSDNLKTGEIECEKWFGDEYDQGTEHADEEEVDEEQEKDQEEEGDEDIEGEGENEGLEEGEEGEHEGEGSDEWSITKHEKLWGEEEEGIIREYDKTGSKDEEEQVKGKLEKIASKQEDVGRTSTERISTKEEKVRLSKDKIKEEEVRKSKEKISSKDELVRKSLEKTVSKHEVKEEKISSKNELVRKSLEKTVPKQEVKQGKIPSREELARKSLEKTASKVVLRPEKIPSKEEVARRSKDEVRKSKEDVARRSKEEVMRKSKEDVIRKSKDDVMRKSKDKIPSKEELIRRSVEKTGSKQEVQPGQSISRPEEVKPGKIPSKEETVKQSQEKIITEENA